MADSDPGFYGTSPIPRAPHVKVTEVVGQADTVGDGEHWVIFANNSSATPWGLGDLLPDGPVRGGPPRGLGRWRISVEFWPEPAK